MLFMGTEAGRLAVLGPQDSARAGRFFNYKPAGADDAALRKNMAEGGWTVVLAQTPDGVDAGGFYLNWDPKYALYRRLGLPEIQDLRVLPDFRRRGMATALIAKGEELARTAGRAGIGLSVGLHAGYGNAQRLYARLGYIPDGHGVTYDREAVIPGEARRIDDDLALMLLKFF